MKNTIPPQAQVKPKSRTQAEFHARGEAASQEFQRTEKSHPASQVIQELHEMLDDKRRRLQVRATLSK